VLLASCFLWWAIADNLTDPLVKVFKEIFGMSTFQASLIQMAFYGGYFCMALPGAMIARKFTYKTGVLIGLGFYAAGCILLYPAMLAERFVLFCLAYYVLASGLGILETNANPYVLALGSEKTATRRLNFAQSFNPIGVALGIVLCQVLIMARLPQDAAGQLSIGAGQAAESLNTVIFPYLSVAAVLVVVWFMILFAKMPDAAEHDKHLHFFSTVGRLLQNGNYVFSASGLMSLMFPTIFGLGCSDLGEDNEAGLLGPDHGHRGRCHHYAYAGRHGRQVGSELLLFAAPCLLRRNQSLRALRPQARTGLPRNPAD
jgi:FHS family L-fucose permease-like MFS transporter